MSLIDILIPTYNRAEFLKENIILLDKQIRGCNLQNFVGLIVSDNGSDDNTVQILSDLVAQIDLNIQIYKHAENLGPEENFLFVLSKSSSSHVMYLGDDDYLPEGYLKFVIEKILQESVYCIIPGYSNLYHGGQITPSRNASFLIKKYLPGFKSVCDLSNYGHQMSGLVFKREGLYDVYMQSQKYRNLYPFIFFATFCLLRGESYYAPKYQVLVTQGNSKHWGYDESGLLIDIFQNYRMAFPNEPFKMALSSLAFVKNQCWRLRIGLKPVNTIKAFLHLMRSKVVSPLVKIPLIAIYPYCYGYRSLCFFKRLISSRLN